MACDLSIIVKDEGLLKVTVIDIYWKCDNISEIKLVRGVTTGH